MVVIFLLSAQPSDDSSALSGAVLQVVVGALDWAARLFGADGFPAAGRDALHLVVRKGAHLATYAVLGALALWALAPRPGGGWLDRRRRTLSGIESDRPGSAPGAARDAASGSGAVVVEARQVGLALLVSVTYAAADEFHQTLVPGRGGAITDVLIDAAGALAGIALLGAWWRRSPAGHQGPRIASPR